MNEAFGAMDHLVADGWNDVMPITEAITAPPFPSSANPDWPLVERAIARRSFCQLATVSSSGRPHVAGVIYVPVGADLWVNTRRSSRKARNIDLNPQVHVAIPVRRVPFGPPSTIQFATTAELFPADDPTVSRLLADGTLRSISSHGELDLPDPCFIRIAPAATVHTYGLGLPLRRLIKDPLHAGGRVERP